MFESSKRPEKSNQQLCKLRENMLNTMRTKHWIETPNFPTQHTAKCVVETRRMREHNGIMQGKYFHNNNNIFVRAMSWILLNTFCFLIHGTFILNQVIYTKISTDTSIAYQCLLKSSSHAFEEGKFQLRREKKKSIWIWRRNSWLFW